MISIRQLHYRYKGSDFILSVPQLDIQRGEKIAIIGSSGSGKTTFLNLISGLIPALSGEIVVTGSKISKMDDAEKRDLRISKIGFIFQDFDLIDYLTALDNVLLPYRINNALHLTNDIRQRALARLEQFNLGKKATCNIKRISRGEQQRIAICRALITMPDLLIADEATENLDPNNKRMAYNVIFDYVNSHHATLVAVTHDHSCLGDFDRTINFDELNTKEA